MSKHQLRLHGSKKKRDEVDTERIGRFLRGDVGLREALTVEQRHLDGLREQARAFYEAGRWSQVADVLIAVAALGAIEPFDAVMLARAYQELGDGANTALWAKTAEDMLAQLEMILRGDQARSATV